MERAVHHLHGTYFAGFLQSPYTAGSINTHVPQAPGSLQEPSLWPEQQQEQHLSAMRMLHKALPQSTLPLGPLQHGNSSSNDSSSSTYNPIYRTER